MDPPSSGLFTEISFRRLLASCTDIINGDTKGRDDLTNWQSSPVFHHYVETLQEQLADLHASGKINDDILHQYGQSVNAIADQLQLVPTPAYLSGAGAYNDSTTGGVTSPTAARVSSATPKLGSRIPIVKPRETQPESSAANLKPIALSDAAKQKLASQGRVQETLTDELADMAASLKSNTLALEGKLKERGDLLESTEDALEESAAKTKKAGAEATALHKRGRMNLCMTCLVLFALGLGLAGMYMFIRVTSFTGYKAAKLQPVPRPPPPVLRRGGVPAPPPPRRPVPPPVRNDEL